MEASLSIAILLAVATLLLPSCTSQSPWYIPPTTRYAGNWNWKPPMPRSFPGWRFGSYPGRQPMACESYPQMCRGNGGQCCQGVCVDMKRDALNCGGCGSICSFGQACCGGGCANLMYDGNNCGSCGNKCKHGSSCSYGMCNYA